MTAFTPAGVQDPRSVAPATSTTLTVRAAGRKALFWVVAAAAAVLVSIVAALVAGGSNAAGIPLAGDNPAPAGSMALVEVLRQQGVEVTLAHSLAEARTAAEASAASTLFFSDDKGYLSAEQLTEMAGLAPRTVIAAPDFRAISTLAPEVGFGGVSHRDALTAHCDLPAAVKAGTLSPGGRTLGVAEPGSAPEGTTLTGCFPSGDNTFSVVERAADAHTLTLVGPAEVFSNDEIASFGNAALALNLLGAGDTLVWYLPTLADVPQTGPPSIGALTPGWVTPTLLLLVLVTVAAAVWRGRRFGPLVAENLPVTVKASETMEGRARLYARSSSRLRALDALRVGAVQRLAGYTGLSRTASLDAVVLAVAAATGHPAPSVRSTLLDAVPATDRELLALSDQLAALERATRRATNPSVPPSQPTQPTQHGRMDP
ncbi:DUF4350 domain-containing protein [Glaciibacter sp. 2TAF33]|uniref:DUF4350 domain-containing protein n=1 Tax=Glaciibacter sp. 2TAF33 TaxID=3233015 RepID=UPI003F92AA42